METFDKIAELRLMLLTRQSRDTKTRTIAFLLLFAELFLSLTLLALVKW